MPPLAQEMSEEAVCGGSVTRAGWVIKKSHRSLERSHEGMAWGRDAGSEDKSSELGSRTSCSS